jgi:hypothetical protein
MVMIGCCTPGQVGTGVLVDHTGGVTPICASMEKQVRSQYCQAWLQTIGPAEELFRPLTGARDMCLQAMM